jgi:RND superfamily putative drug exporter
MDTLARWLCRYARWVLVVVVVLLVFCGLYSARLTDRLSGGGWTVPGSEEERAERAQDAGFAGRGSSSVTVVVRDDRFSAPSTEFHSRVADVTQRIAADPRLRVHGQMGWTTTPAPQRDEFLGRDRRTALTTLELGIDDGTAKRVLPEVDRELHAFEADGLHVYLVGQAAAFAATNEVGSASLARVEVVLPGSQESSN